MCYYILSYVVSLELFMFPGLYKTYFYGFSHFKVLKKNGFWTFINVQNGPLAKQNAREKT